MLDVVEDEVLEIEVLEIDVLEIDALEVVVISWSPRWPSMGPTKNAIKETNAIGFMFIADRS